MCATRATIQIGHGRQTISATGQDRAKICASHGIERTPCIRHNQQFSFVFRLWKIGRCEQMRGPCCTHSYHPVHHIRCIVQRVGEVFNAYPRIRVSQTFSIKLAVGFVEDHEQRLPWRCPAN